MTSIQTSAPLQTNAAAMPPDSATTTDEAQPFRLLDLPDELWARIGNMVIEASESIHVTRSDPEGLKRKPPPILHTCSALRNELLLSYYSAKIKIDLTPYCPWDTNRLHENLGDYLRAVGPETARTIAASYSSNWDWSGYYQGEEEREEHWRALQRDLERLEDLIGCHVEILTKRVERRNSVAYDERTYWEVAFVKSVPPGGRRMLRD